MALSADEQRELAEIERRLATDDPGLATCLTAFRRPGPGRVLRSPRARIIGSLFTVLLVAMVSLMVYAMIPFRSHVARPTVPPSASTQDKVSVAATGKPHSSPPASANASARSGAVAAASTMPPDRSATPSAGSSAGASGTQPSSSQAAAQVASSPPGP